MKQTKTQTTPKLVKEEAPIDYSQYGVTGYEKTTTEDLGIPFLVIVQKGSPEVDKTHKDYATKKVPGAEAGDIVNTVTRRIIHKNEGEALLFVPCTYERQYVEWKPRETAGGGFVRQHQNSDVLNECRRNEKNQDVLPNGNLIVTTGYFFGQFKEHDSWDKAIISMTSTQLKKARLWLNMMMAIKQNGQSLPMFSHKYAITSIIEQNQSGSWFGWHVEGAGMVKGEYLLKSSAEIAKKNSQNNRPQLGAPAVTSDDVPM